jgi:hypothetical protein
MGHCCDRKEDHSEHTEDKRRCVAGVCSVSYRACEIISLYVPVDYDRCIIWAHRVREAGIDVAFDRSHL